LNEEAKKLASHKATNHAINLVEGKEPPLGPLYNLSGKELQVLQEYLANALEKGHIRHSTSPAGSPVLFMPKKDGRLQLCVDYWGPNAITVKNRHPLPLITEILDCLSGGVVFTKLDLKDAFNHIHICEGDEWKTAFHTHYGHFKYLVMLFGLTNTPATFQGYINWALVGLVNIICIVYLDDILIFSASEAEHMNDVCWVLEHLEQHSLYVNLKKCEFWTKSIKFLGFIVSTDGVSMDKHWVATISEWPSPKMFCEIQVFLGFANFYRHFIEGYAWMATPITQLLVGMKNSRKTGLFEWPVTAEKAFQSLYVLQLNFLRV
jgi:hypothetical protein